ncbi:MAG TPA: hypothetical protein VLL52_24830, partial [Anaerolineae bacterium]|nr:hypothetical protein [Anaerolineae bacterium]
MKTKDYVLLLAVIVSLVINGAMVYSQGKGLEKEQGESMMPVGSGFTYQGELNVMGAPANGTYDITFRLYDSVTGGTQIGGGITQT